MLVRPHQTHLLYLTRHPHSPPLIMVNLITVLVLTPVTSSCVPLLHWKRLAHRQLTVQPRPCRSCKTKSPVKMRPSNGLFAHGHDGWMCHGTRRVEQVETKVDPILCTCSSPNNKVKYHECNLEWDGFTSWTGEKGRRRAGSVTVLAIKCSNCVCWVGLRGHPRRHHGPSDSR
jgi:hypothetical protein